VFVLRAEISGYTTLSSAEFALFLVYFEMTRTSVVRDRTYAGRTFRSGAPAARLFTIYESRSSARVSDVSSVILRDAVLWLTFEEFSQSRVGLSHLGVVGIGRLHAALKTEYPFDDEDVFARRLIDHGWGQLA
jgi:hypothetical protein